MSWEKLEHDLWRRRIKGGYIYTSLNENTDDAGNILGISTAMIFVPMSEVNKDHGTLDE